MDKEWQGDWREGVWSWMQSWNLWECVGTGSLSRGYSAACPVVILLLLSVFNTVTLDLQGLWKFLFRFNLGSPLIAELISAFLKFLADHPLAEVDGDCEMGNYIKPGKSCLFFAPSDGSFCTLCAHRAFTPASCNLKSDNNNSGHSLAKRL